MCPSGCAWEYRPTLTAEPFRLKMSGVHSRTIFVWIRMIYEVMLYTFICWCISVLKSMSGFRTDPEEKCIHLISSEVNQKSAPVTKP